MTRELWVCIDHERPEGTCQKCGVVKPCPPAKRFTPQEVADALHRARDLAREQTLQRRYRS